MTLRDDLKATVKMIKRRKAEGLKQAVIDLEDKVSVLWDMRERREERR